MTEQNYKRVGNDIYTSTTITFKDAILGCKKEIKSLTKTVNLTIPPGTQPNTQMRLKGLGLAVNDIAGDLFVNIKVTIPENISDKQKDLLDKWEDF